MSTVIVTNLKRDSVEFRGTLYLLLHRTTNPKLDGVVRFDQSQCDVEIIVIANNLLEGNAQKRIIVI